MKIRRSNNGFSLLEVVIGMTILVLVATTAIASLRSGVTTLHATENNAIAIDAIREFSEYSYGFTLAELDILDDFPLDQALDKSTVTIPFRRAGGNHTVTPPRVYGAPVRTAAT